MQEREKNLTGTTLKVYKHILKANKPLRISDIQRALGLSTASLAQYHVAKLLEMGLVREEGNGYVVEKVVIQNVFRIRRTLVPYQIAYVIFFSCTLVALVVGLAMVRHPVVTSFVFIALVANTSAVGISIYEMLRTIRTLA